MYGDNETNFLDYVGTKLRYNLVWVGLDQCRRAMVEMWSSRLHRPTSQLNRDNDKQQPRG